MTIDSLDTAGWDMTKVIPGEVIQPDTDDVAPGVLEVVPDRTPVLYNAGSAAMVVAAKTGRAVGLSTRWFGVGAMHTAILAWRYVRAHDHQEVLGGMATGADWNRILDTRRKRWWTIGWTAGATAVLDLAGWWALVQGAGMTALDYSWAILPGAEALAVAAAVTLYGRYRVNNPGIPAGQVLADDDTDDGEEPFPLAWCRDGQQVEECVSRALYAEGIGTRRIQVLGHCGWGWEVDIDLKGSTPGKVAAVADQLDAHFDVKKGGTMIEPDPQRSAHITLRIITADPFTGMPKPAVHAPMSLDIAEPHNFGRCMDGAPLDIVLEGTRILVIGVSGAAKSTGVLRDLAEAITACHNAIALDLDPVKDGLREFEGVMAAPPIRGNEACEKWLGHLVKMAEARNGVRNRLGMGDTWVATEKHPAIFPFVDEFIYLSQKAKELFIQLLRLGRQTGIYPVAAGQDATSDSLGDAIADSFTLRIMLASREEDIRLVLGSGAKAAGFRPDRLEPAQNKDIRNDAGRSYIRGAGLVRPLQYGWNEHSRAAIEKAVADRAEVGRPWFDRDTLIAADLLHVVTRNDGQAAGESTLVDQLEACDDERGAQLATLLRLYDAQQADFLPTAALVETGAVDDAAGLQLLLRKLVDGAASERQWVGEERVRGWSKAVIEKAAAALFAPV